MALPAGGRGFSLANHAQANEEALARHLCTKLEAVHPNLLHIGPITLPTFGALAALGLMFALTLSQRTARRAGIDPDKLWDAGLFAVLAAFILSRLLLVAAHFASFRQYPILLLAVPSLTPTGLLLTAVATFLWLYFKRIPILSALDAWAPCATLVWAFLALGHFAEGSDPGLPTRLPWGIQMPGDATRLHPVAIYAAMVALILTVTAYRKPNASVTLIAAGTAQFLLSFVRQPGLDTIGGLDALQLVALGMIVAGCVLHFAMQPIRGV
jgi:phosphatidylglycerol:prolipoprotein diacylglycerol transferase